MLLGFHTKVPLCWLVIQQAVVSTRVVSTHVDICDVPGAGQF